MERKRVFLGMPGYDGLVTDKAAASFWNATRGFDDIVRMTPEDITKRLGEMGMMPTITDRGYRAGSLLACTFNMLWCDALNRKLVDNEQVDYFAMQHSDVGGEFFWLDTLIEEMEKHDLDMLGVVVPIKDMRGRTSIALDKLEPDPWKPLCRLTMEEVYRLPETFTSEDVLGHPLLLNTGMWVCRFTEEIAKKGFFFTVNDEIIFDTTLKRYIPICESEDWNFSRKWNRLGLRIGATRKVKVDHRGYWEFGSHYPWGEKFDRDYLGESIIPDDGFRFPWDVDGWLDFEEGRKLYELAKGKRVLEIGSFCGRSTICIAQSAASVDSVDPHDGRGAVPGANTFTKFSENLRRYNVDQVVTPHISTAREFCRRPSLLHYGDKYDLIFIDGAHDYASVQSDIEDAMLLLADDGLLAFHDYKNQIDPDVERAVDEFLSDGAELISTHVSLAVVRPPAAVPLEV